MNARNRNEEREEILCAFDRACERPTAEQINVWIDRFPQYAEDIRARAIVSRDWAAREDEQAPEASEELLARGYSNALNALYNAEQEASRKTSAPKTLHEIASARGKEVFQLAAELDIDRGVIADLFNGCMKPPIRKRLIDAVGQALEITRQTFDAAFEYTRANPRLGLAKARAAPTLLERTCDDIIRDSNMSSDRKRYWLEED